MAAVVVVVVAVDVAAVVVVVVTVDVAAVVVVAVAGVDIPRAQPQKLESW